MRPHLIVFAKAPALGRAKRRLAADVGPVAAWQFYRRTLATLVRRLADDPHWRTVLAVTPDSAARQGGRWPPGVPRMPQGAGDLGRRMDRALRRVPPGPVVLVGSDLPDLMPRHIGRAFAMLHGRDLVFGPATDGGFWLVGTRNARCLPYLFRGVRWSGPHALADTLANAGGRFGVGFADMLSDVDDGADLTRRQAPLSPSAAGRAPASGA